MITLNLCGYADGAALTRLLVLIGVVVVVGVAVYLKEMFETLKREMDEVDEPTPNPSREGNKDFANDTPHVDADGPVIDSFSDDDDFLPMTNDY